MKSLFKKYGQISTTLMDQGILSLVNFLVSILIVRFLGIEAFGIYTLLWMSVLFLQSLQTAMIITPMMSIGPKQTDKDKSRYIGVIISHQLVFSTISSIFLYISIILSDYIIPQWYITDYAISLSLVSFLSQNQDFIRRLLFLEGRSSEALINDSVCYVGRFLMISIVCLGSDPTLKSIFNAILIALFLSVLLGMVKLNKPILNFKNNIEVLKRHWKMSKWLSSSALLMWFSGNYFFVVTALLLGPATVGIFRASSNIIGIFNILFLGLENIIPQSASKYFVISGIAGLKSYVKKLVLIGGLAISCASVILIIFAEPLIIAVYGEEYAGNGYILIWYSIISILIYLILPFNIGLRTLEKTQPQFISYLVTVFFSLITANFLISNFELNGAMFGMMINQLIMLFVAILFFERSCRQIVDGDKNIDS